MVQTDKVIGQMVLAEDGTIISSSGDLSSSEATSQQIVSLINSTFPVALKCVVHPPSGQPAAAGSGNGHQNTGFNKKSTGSTVNASTSMSNGADLQQSPKVSRIVRPIYWKSITVDFGNHSYVACLSNRKIHVVKRERVLNNISEDHHYDDRQQ